MGFFKNIYDKIQRTADKKEEMKVRREELAKNPQNKEAKVDIEKQKEIEKTNDKNYKKAKKYCILTYIFALPCLAIEVFCVIEAFGSNFGYIVLAPISWVVLAVILKKAKYYADNIDSETFSSKGIRIKLSVKISTILCFVLGVLGIFVPLIMLFTK